MFYLNSLKQHSLDLHLKLKKEIYEELDVSLDISDDYLYEIIDECIYKATAVKRLSLNQREMLRTRLYNSIKKLDVLQELIEDDEITEIMINKKIQIKTSHNTLILK